MYIIYRCNTYLDNNNHDGVFTMGSYIYTRTAELDRIVIGMAKAQIICQQMVLHSIVILLMLHVCYVL